MRKMLSAVMVAGLMLVGPVVLSGTAQAAHYTTLVYKCSGYTYTYNVPTYLAPSYEKKLHEKGCTKVSSNPTAH